MADDKTAPEAQPKEAEEQVSEEATEASAPWLDDHEDTVRQAIERLEELSADNARLEKAHARLKKENERLSEQAEKLRDKAAKVAREAKAAKSDKAPASDDGDAEAWQEERAEIRQRVESLTDTQASLLED